MWSDRSVKELTGCYPVSGNADCRRSANSRRSRHGIPKFGKGFTVGGNRQQAQRGIRDRSRQQRRSSAKRHGCNLDDQLVHETMVMKLPHQGAAADDPDVLVPRH